MLTAGHNKEHFVSVSMVSKPDGIEAAWRNNFSSLSGLPLPKCLIISSFCTSSPSSLPVKLALITWWSLLCFHLSYPDSSVVCRETRRGQEVIKGRLRQGYSANVCVCSQMSGLDYEPREELILADELPLIDSLPLQ